MSPQGIGLLDWGQVMCLYDEQIYVQIPAPRIGVDVEEEVRCNFHINPRHSTS